MKQYNDITIIGAGPGAIQLGISLLENSVTPPSFVLLEQNDHAGSFYTRFPVHGTLISNNKLYTGHPAESRFAEKFDWNSLITKPRKRLMRHYCRNFYPKSAAVVDMLCDLVKDYDLPIEYQTECSDIEKLSDGSFKVTTNQGEFHSKYVVIATGLKARQVKIKGIEHTTAYEDMRSKEYYRDRRVLIIGKGNSGMECAQEILNEANVIMVASRHSTKLAYKTHYVGNIRAVNAFLVENYMLKHQASLLDCQIQNIEPKDDGYEVTVAYTHAEGEVEKLFFHEIINATGFEADYESLVQKYSLKKLHERFPSVDGKFESTELEGLYFAGAQTHGLDYKSTSSSGFIHGFRYNSIVLGHHLLSALSANKRTHKTIKDEDFEEYIFSELFNDAGIYLQNSFISLLFRKNEDGTWDELGYRTTKWFKESSIGKDETLVAVSLEYGDIHKYPDPLSIPRYPGQPEESVHIHPVIYKRTTAGIEELHLEENLENNFTNTPLNEQLLHDFLEDSLSASPVKSPIHNTRGSFSHSSRGEGLPL